MRKNVTVYNENGFSTLRFKDTLTPRLITNFDAYKKPAYEMAIAKHPEFPDLHLIGNSLWGIGYKDLSVFWRTYEQILASDYFKYLSIGQRFMLFLVNFTTTGENWNEVINWRAKGDIKQEDVYIPVSEGEKTDDIIERAKALFAARYGDGAFKIEYVPGFVEMGNPMWIKEDSIILQ